MSQLQHAIDQIVYARDYTVTLLDQTPTSEWFRMPPGGVSHIGWQVGHLAIAQYRLALWRYPRDAASRRYAGPARIRGAFWV